MIVSPGIILLSVIVLPVSAQVLVPRPQECPMLLPT